MHVRCLLFASLRDVVGQAELELDLPEGSRVDDLIGVLEQRYPALSQHRAHFQVAVDLELVPSSTVLSEGAEVALLPPVSGGDPGQDLIRLSEGEIDLEACLSAVNRPDCGATVLFLGNVRDSCKAPDGSSEPVEFIDYSAYSAMASKELEQLARRCREKFPVGSLALWHRLGVVRAGQASVAVAVSTPHRAAAFEAGRWLIDELKRNVPIWKKEVGPEGAVWIEGDARTATS